MIKRRRGSHVKVLRKGRLKRRGGGGGIEKKKLEFRQGGGKFCHGEMTSFRIDVKEVRKGGVSH